MNGHTEPLNGGDMTVSELRDLLHEDGLDLKPHRCPRTTIEGIKVVDWTVRCYDGINGTHLVTRYSENLIHAMFRAIRDGKAKKAVLAEG